MTDNQYIFLSTISFIANQCPERTVGFHKLSKILYFAEQKHLVKYGSKLTNDTFIAMQNGPVPSATYDILKNIRDYPEDVPNEIRNSFNVSRHYITSTVESDLDWLSESEIECLNESILENRDLSFIDLTNKSHDAAWREDIRMDTIKIAEAGGANEQIIAYIQSNLERTSY